MINDKVEILLATYNGEKYLGSLFESIKNQTYANWVLIIRDDDSTDTTLKIIQQFKTQIKNSNQVICVKDNKGKLGPTYNFSVLLQKSTADYIMFCDQDDVWKPEKIELSVNKLIYLESLYGRDTPILVHTDLTVVNEKLEQISPSFWQMQKLDPSIGANLNKLLFHNVITGCTMLINRAAIKRVISIPKQAVMHDYWISLIVAKYGIIEYIPQSTIFYRQHQKNEIGTKIINFEYVFGQFISFFTKFRKYLIMFSYLPFKPNIGISILQKIFISIKRFIFPTNLIYNPRFLTKTWKNIETYYVNNEL